MISMLSLLREHLLTETTLKSMEMVRCKMELAFALTPKRTLLTLRSGAIMIVLAFTPILVCFT